MQTNITKTLNTLLGNTGKFVTLDVFNSRVSRRVNGRIVQSSKNYVTIRPANAKKAVKFNKSSIVEAVGQGMVYSRV
jgi:hypothetical protein